MLPAIDYDKRVVTLTEFPAPKKITATRLAGLLGLSKYSTPFKVWTELHRMSFEDLRDNPYLAAGKLLEPRVISYLQGNEKDIVTPNEFYGKFVMDAFPDDPVFGGIPDVYRAPAGKLEEIIEIKTTSNLAQWADGPPAHYFIQAAFYAYKHGVDKFRVVALYLGDYDINNLDEIRQIRPTKSNTLTFQFSLKEDALQIVEQMEYARRWYTDHALTGISPVYDKDKDYGSVEDIKGYLTQFADKELAIAAERLNYLVNRKDMLSNLAKDNQSEITALTAQLKVARIAELVPAVYGGLKLTLTPTKTETVDKTALQTDGLFEKYMKVKNGTKFSVTLDKTMLETTILNAILFKHTGELRVQKLRVINRSISEGLYYALCGVYDTIETTNYVLAYVSIEDSAHSQIFQIGALNVFGRCIVYRKDLTDIKEVDEYGEFLTELNEVFNPEIQETTMFGGV